MNSAQLWKKDGIEFSRVRAALQSRIVPRQQAERQGASMRTIRFVVAAVAAIFLAQFQAAAADKENMIYLDLKDGRVTIELFEERPRIM